MELGFIGTGTITASIVTGLGDTFAATGRIHLSPRSQSVAQGLTERFGHVEVAGSNQDVADRSEVVVLAIRPQIAQGVIQGVRFRPDHHVISLVPTFSAEALRALVSPAGRLAKAVPLPSAAHGHSATAIYPRDPVAADLFGRIGAAVQVDNPGAFEALTAATATMASYFTFAGAVADWLIAQHLPAEDAIHYVNSIFYGLALTAQHTEPPDFAVLATQHATPGGLNEQLASHLTHSGVFTQVQSGLDAILARLQAPRVD